MRIDRIYFVILLILGTICLVAANADAYSTQKQYTDFSYSFTSNNASNCNVTQGFTPNGIINLNQIATRNGQTFNFTIPGGTFSLLGTYCFNIVCSDGSQYETGSVCKDVTKTGYSNSIIIWILLLVVGFGLLIFGAVFKNAFFGLLSGMVIGATGVFLMIYGVDVIADSWTRMIAGTILGVGLMIMIYAMYSILTGKSDEVSAEFD